MSVCRNYSFYQFLTRRFTPSAPAASASQVSRRDPVEHVALPEECSWRWGSHTRNPLKFLLRPGQKASCLQPSPTSLGSDRAAKQFSSLLFPPRQPHVSLRRERMRFVLPGHSWKPEGMRLGRCGVSCRARHRVLSPCGSSRGTPSSRACLCPPCLHTYLVRIPCPPLSILFLHAAAGWQLQMFWERSLCRRERAWIRGVFASGCPAAISDSSGSWADQNSSVCVTLLITAWMHTWSPAGDLPTTRGAEGSSCPQDSPRTWQPPFYRRGGTLQARAALLPSWRMGFSHAQVYHK